MGSPEIKILLKDKWKQDPPMSDEQQTKLVLHVVDHTLTKGLQETTLRKEQT